MPPRASLTQQPRTQSLGDVAQQARTSSHDVAKAQKQQPRTRSSNEVATSLRESRQLSETVTGGVDRNSLPKTRRSKTICLNVPDCQGDADGGAGPLAASVGKAEPSAVPVEKKRSGFDLFRWFEEYTCGSHVCRSSNIGGGSEKLNISGQAAIDDFILYNTVGVGACGRVMLAKWKSAGAKSEPLAVKMLRKHDVVQQKFAERVKVERQILSMCSSPFIVSLTCAFEDARRLYLVMEYANGGDLFGQISQKGKLSNNDARFYAAEVSLAFEHIHRLNIVYRDLKPENLLLDFEGHIKVTDFGFAKVVADSTWTLCGTPDYLAPETIQYRGHGRGVDWWALGVLVFEMIAGSTPFADDNPMIIYQKVLAGRVSFTKQFDLKAKDIIKRLLKKDAKKRVGCCEAGPEDYKSHDWNGGLDWERLSKRRIKPPFVPGVAKDNTSLYEKYPESLEGSAPVVGDNSVFEGFSTSA